MPIHSVVTSDDMSAMKTMLVCVCNQCGFRWIPLGKKKPTRCPSRGCRSIAWDEAKRPKRAYSHKEGRPRKGGKRRARKGKR